LDDFSSDLIRARAEALSEAEHYAGVAAPKDVDAHDCALRAVCEVAENPLHDDGDKMTFN